MIEATSEFGTKFKFESHSQGNWIIVDGIAYLLGPNEPTGFPRYLNHQYWCPKRFRFRLPTEDAE